MARPRKFTKELTAEELSLLQGISQSRTEELRRVQRAKVMLLCSQGRSNQEISAQVGLSNVSISKILKKWITFGVKAALEDLPRGGRPKVIGIEARTWIVSLACTIPDTLPDGPRTQLWTVTSLTHYIQTHCGKQMLPELQNIQPSTVWSVLNDRQIKPHRMKYYLVRKDPEFKEKAEKVLLLYKRVEWILQMTRNEVAQGERPDELCGEVFLSYDEKPGTQAVSNIAPDLPATAATGCVARDYEYRRLGTMSLLAGIDLLNGEVTGIVRDTHGAPDFISFLQLLDEKYEKSLKINIILDNHSVHRSKAVMQYLTTKPERFAFTFTPKHASWLNLIESFFSKLAKQALRGLRVKSKDDLRDRIEKWLEATNNDRVVYRWKWKLEDIESAFT
jgi:transposase